MCNPLISKASRKTKPSYRDHWVTFDMTYKRNVGHLTVTHEISLFVLVNVLILLWQLNVTVLYGISIG